MIINSLEEILIKFCFIIFFLITLFSWIKIPILETKTIPYNNFWKNEFIKIGIFFGFIFLTGLCLLRWKISNHLPLSNLYESSLFLAWSLIFLYLIFQRKIESEWLDAIIAPIILIITTFSTLGLPKELQKSSVLVPALQSNWLMMHVSMMILSYGALLLGSLLAVTLLVIVNPFSQKENIFTPNRVGFSETIEVEGERRLSKEKKNSLEKFLKLSYLQKYKINLVEQIDYWSYRIIGIGFPFLTLGILSGAVWANEAWGSYWSWDPKETWALIIWVIFAIYLHTRLNKGWIGKKPALVASLGFFVVWMCYLGVNLLGKGLHSYGWLN